MFISLEGIEGSGKTTQIHHIAGFLEERSLTYRLTREPGATRAGESIRAILLDPKNKKLAPHAELLLYMADRIQHVKEIISPSLLAGETVVCDRFYDAYPVKSAVRQAHRPEPVEGWHLKNSRSD